MLDGTFHSAPRAAWAEARIADRPCGSAGNRSCGGAVRKLNRRSRAMRKLVLTIVTLAMLMPLAHFVVALAAQRSAEENRPAFEVTSVRPNRSGNPGMMDNLGQTGGHFTLANNTLRVLIAEAYNLSLG